MAIYRWDNDVLIQEVELQPYGKSNAATIRLSEKLSIEKIAALSDALNAVGLRAVEDWQAGFAILRVRDIKDSNTLLAVLEQNGYVDNSQRREIETAAPSKPGFLKKAQSRIMMLDGFLTLVGDVFLMGAALRHGKKSGINELKSGSVYALESLALITMGHITADRAFRDEQDHLLQFMSASGVPVPEIDGTSAEKLGKGGGPAGVVAREFRRQPTVSLNVAVTIAGSQLAMAGFKQEQGFRDWLKGEKDKDGKETLGIRGGYAKATAGAMIGSGMLAALLIPERNKQELLKDAEKHPGFLHQVKRFALERPERIASWLAVGNNFAQIISSFQEKKGYDTVLKNFDPQREKNLIQIRGKEINISPDMHAIAKDKEHDWIYTLASSAFYLTANGLLTWASKSGHIEKAEGTSSLQEDMYATAAQYISRMPEGAEQDLMVKKTAYMLASRSHTGETQEQVEGEIMNRMRMKEEMKQNWRQRVVVPTQKEYTLRA